jgi:CheY-like chemotaxis protein
LGVLRDAPSRTLLLPLVEERELAEVDGLLAGAAPVGPTAQDGLQEQHRLRQRQAGADDYIRKPFSPEELGARVQAILGRR